MSLPRYESYKDSGVEWLGEVPAGWNVIPIQRLSVVKRGASPRPINDSRYFDDDGERGWVRISDVSASENGQLADTTQRLSELGASLSVPVEPGDLFVSIAGTVGTPCISKIKACIHDGFVYFPELDVDPRFLFRIFEAGYCYGGLGKFGTQLNLNTETVGQIKVAVPPAEELAAILAYLDRETARIDGLVAEQRRLIGLLAEKRRAAISRAVTRGLDSAAPRKPTGVPWLGDVPEHWEVVPLTRCLLGIEQGDSPPCYQEPAEIGEWGVLKVGACNSVFLNESEQKKLPDELEPKLNNELRRGDVVVSRGNTAELVGSAACFDSDRTHLLLSDLTYRLKIDRRVADPLWITFLLRSSSGRGQIESVATGTSASMKKVSQSDLRGLVVTRPPIREQKQITASLLVSLENLGGQEADAESAIALLLERRSALISAAVTGQIDVRQVAFDSAV